MQSNAASQLPVIYALSDPETMELRYIGKTDNPTRRLHQHIHYGDPSMPVSWWIRTLKTRGLRPVMDIIERDCEDWQESERRWIRRALDRKVRLLNIREGGIRGQRLPWIDGRPIGEAEADQMRQDALRMIAEMEDREVRRMGLCLWLRKTHMVRVMLEPVG